MCWNMCARVLGAVLCSQPFRRCLEAASLGAPRPHGWCRRLLAGRPRAHVLTGSLNRSGGDVRERREGQAARAGGQVGCPWGHRAGAWNGSTVGPKPCPQGWGSGRASALRSRVPTDLWVAPSRSETSRVRFHSSAGGLKSLGAHPHLSRTQTLCVRACVCVCVCRVGGSGRSAEAGPLPATPRGPPWVGQVPWLRAPHRRPGSGQARG